MDIDHERTAEETTDRAIELLEHLLYVADGDSKVSIGTYEASTILALLMDESYRIEVMSRISDFDSIESEL